MKAFKKGDKVKIVSNEGHHFKVGSIGYIIETDVPVKDFAEVGISIFKEFFISQYVNYSEMKHATKTDLKPKKAKRSNCGQEKETKGCKKNFCIRHGKNVEKKSNTVRTK